MLHIPVAHAVPDVQHGCPLAPQHTPATQDVPVPVHTVPHAPQLLLSVVVLTQVADVLVPHVVGNPAGQVHVPLVHIEPLAHSVPPQHEKPGAPQAARQP